MLWLWWQLLRGALSLLLHLGWAEVATMLPQVHYDKHSWIICCPLHLFRRPTTTKPPFSTAVIVSETTLPESLFRKIDFLMM